MTESTVQSEPPSEKESPTTKVEISVQIDPELLDQINHLTSDPSKVIEVAVRQWLKGGNRRDDDLTRSLRRNPPVPPRGEWND
ncbi:MULTISPECIES: hypothetical protein [unclassified Leptolyngbya]|uniref:hypothetical protein n=1 Tax=unclassified Leptolyngbya TaxID=2650499 RepID=UPI00168584B4|nr:MULTISPECIES: hypothetical protein [unclassified Leptolyngbya]MBD1909552.1 hypothetical protein [Leptolyngbya sp. FACHB-8]MBD2154090.1 hypothetical protein [Leptolyngbya sp. FACHB-16]